MSFSRGGGPSKSWRRPQQSDSGWQGRSQESNLQPQTDWYNASGPSNYMSRGGTSSEHGGRGGRGRGRGRGGGNGGGRPHASGLSPSAAGVSSGRDGHLQCDYVFPADDPVRPSQACGWRAPTALAMTLHKADRHLIYPPGGAAALKRIDPMLIEEERERKRREKKGWDDDESAAQGLTVDLSSPDMLQQWIAERKKRWPTAQAIERKKIEDDWQGKSNDKARTDAHRDKRQRIEGDPPPIQPTPRQTSGNSSMVHTSARQGAEDENAEDSNSDAPVEEASTRPVEVPAEAEGAACSASTRPVCKFWLQGRCGYGDNCRNLHETADGSVPAQRARPAHLRNTPRPRPRSPPPNPFEQPDLLRQMLSKEIDQHVDATIQAIRFLSRNGWLVNVEREIGAAEQQRKRRGMIVEVGTDAKTDDHDGLNAEHTGPSVTDGALPTVPSLTTPGASSLYRPTSPLLRPLVELQWPPEPDPMIFVDPLKREDPKPLRPAQLEEFALDAQVREVLCPANDLHPEGELNKALARGLDSLLALPSEAHRFSAIELILGVSPLSPAHAHDASSLHRWRDGSSGGAGGLNKRKAHNETELFRLGLRIGPNEVPLVRKIAERVSQTMDGRVDYEAQSGSASGTTQEDIWRAEGERRDRLRKLGIEVD